MPEPTSESRMTRLIISIDIGTTFSSVAVLYLTKEGISLTTWINMWPGQESRLDQETVPSLLLYDKQKNLIGCGAEVHYNDRDAHKYILQRPDSFIAPRNKERTAGLRVGEQRFFAQRDSSFARRKSAAPIEELSPDIDNRFKYTDYINYLICHSRRFLTKQIGTDPLSTADEVNIILTHPPQWEDFQKTMLKEATSGAPVLQDRTDIRIHLIAEDAALMSFSISYNPLMARNLVAGTQVILCHADGLTGNVMSYKVCARDGIATSLVESRSTGCASKRIVGFRVVDATFRQYLHTVLDPRCNLGLEEQQDIQALPMSPEQVSTLASAGLRDFQSRARCQVSSTPLEVRIGEPDLDIQNSRVGRGIISFRWPEVENIFKPMVDPLVVAITRCRGSDRTPLAIVLSGELGLSVYVTHKLQASFGEDSVIPLKSAKSRSAAMGGLKLFLSGDVRIARPAHSISGWESLLRQLRTIARACAGRVLSLNWR